MKRVNYIDYIYFIFLTGTILLFPFVVWDGFYSVAGLPKLLFLALSVTFLSFLSLFTSWRSPKREMVVLGSIIVFLGGMLAWNIYASSDIWSSVVGSLERSMGWVAYSLIFLFVFLSFALAREILTFRILSRIITSVGVGLSLIALGQKYGLFGESFLGSMIFEGRAMSTIGQYNTLGALLILPLGLLFFSKGQKSSTGNQIIFFSVLAILFLGIWTTGSRIALLGGVGLIFLFLTPERWRRYLLTGGILLGSIVFAFSGNFMSEAGHASLESRKLLFHDAVTDIGGFTFSEHILGRGFESVESSLLHQYSPKYLAYEQIEYIPDRSHSIFLDTYIQFGILGSIVFFMIFLIFPFLVFWKGESLVSRNIGLLLLVHFGVTSVGFYDISNLLFASILIGFLYFSKGLDGYYPLGIKKTLPRHSVFITESRFLPSQEGQKLKILHYTLIFLSLLISLSSLYLLSQDAREQSSYTQSQITSDDPLELIEADIIPDRFTTWKRDDLISKVLAKKLDAIETPISDSLFQEMCRKDSYHVLQVCVRRAFLQGDFSLLRAKVDTLLTLAPHDVVALSLDMELAKHEENREKEREIAKTIISLFPSFIFADDGSLSDYQKRKKEKIRAHYPFDDWLERAK